MTQMNITEADILKYLSLDQKTWHYINTKCPTLRTYLMEDVKHKIDAASKKKVAGKPSHEAPPRKKREAAYGHTESFEAELDLLGGEGDPELDDIAGEEDSDMAPEDLASRFNTI